MSTHRNFKTALRDLADLQRPFAPANLYCFSDLDRDEVAALQAVWPNLPASRRLALVQDLSDLAEANVEVDPEAACRVGLKDHSPEVRVAAIEGLWESEASDLPSIFLSLLADDPEHTVRAAAASALGGFVYLAEIEELDSRLRHRLEDALLRAATGGDHLEVRRRALEALGFSSRPEVPPLIEAAYAAPQELLKASALFAMGRSADSRWRQPVLEELGNLTPALRLEAVRAAGELGLRAAVPALIEAAEDADVEVRASATWSLGQIGGQRARRALDRLLKAAVDEDEAEQIQEALDELDFMEGPDDFPLLEMDGEAGEASDEEDDEDFPDEDDDEPGMFLN